MTDTHVVSALKTKRIQVASQIESLQGQLRQATIDLDHVEAALRLIDLDVDLAALSPRTRSPQSSMTPRATPGWSFWKPSGSSCARSPRRRSAMS
jgi:hypothetical protein